MLEFPFAFAVGLMVIAADIALVWLMLLLPAWLDKKLKIENLLLKAVVWYVGMLISVVIFILLWGAFLSWTKGK